LIDLQHRGEVPKMLPGSSIVAAPMMRWRISDWP